MAYYIITEIEGVKQYLRRYRVNKHGFVAPTMVTANISKAMSFTKERAYDMFSRMGIGYAIEAN